MAESQNIEYKESSTLIDQPKTLNRQDVGKDVGLAEKIIEMISDNSEIKND